MSRDLIFHLLDLQARDQRVENETEDAREVVYESADEESDEEMGYGRKRPVAKKTDYNANREYVIHLFGSTAEGKPVRVDVTGFRPYFYLRLPEVDTGKAIEAIRYYMTTQGIPMAKIGFKRVMSKQFYGFTAGKLFPFLQIDMPSLSLFRTVQKLFLDEKSNPQTKRPLDPPLRGKQVEVYESNIDPMLRFLHIQNIQPCGWVKIPGGMTYIDDVNAEQWAFECNYEDILPAVGPKAVAPFLLASWDIECYSSTGDFPLAKRGWTKFAKDSVNECDSAAVVAGRLIEYLNKVPCGLKKSMDAIKEFVYSSKVQDKINTIITAYADDDAIKELTKYLEKEMKNFVSLKGDPVIQIGITLTRGGELDRHLFVFPDCDPIPGITVHAYKDEKTMINRFFAWIVDQNPDILVGYNVFGFDEKYLWERAEELGCIGSDSPVHELTRLFELGSEVKCEEKFLSSSALGDNVMHIWSTHGRLQIDLYHYIRRTAVLPSYKLDEVTKHYMSGKLKKFRQEGGRLYLDVAGAIQDVRPGRAVCLLDETGESITEKLIVLEVNGGTIVTAAVEDDVDLEDARKWVIVKDDVGPQDIFRLHRGSSADRAIVGKYCLQDCDLVLELYKKLEVFNNTMSMANVCTVPIGYIFTRGQGIKIESLIFKACREHNTLIPVLSAPKQKGEAEDSYEGAIVLDPVPGFYSQSPIGVADFASLYPSSIESENLSHDSIVWVRDYDYNGNLIANVFGSDEYAECEGYGYTDIDFDLWRPDPADKRKHPVKVKSGRRVCRYAQPLDGSKSTLPEIIRQLLAARKAKRKEAEKEESAERKALLDAEQLAYKLTANSLYGQLGSGTFKIRMQHLAASTTAYGRKQILFAKAAIEKFYGPGANDPRCCINVMYGDTDSLFIEFNPRNPETGERLTGREARQATIDLTAEAGKLVTKALAPPHDFEFDKIFDPMLMFSKKRYAGNMYEENADDFVHKYMGIALKRRDNAPIVKTIFGGAMKKLLLEKDVIGATKFVKESCMELVNGNVSLNQLTITKSLRADYADPTRIAHKALADRMAERDPGNAPSAGDRIGYIYIKPDAGQQSSKLQGDRIEHPSYVREKGLSPDYRFYVEHQIQNPVSQMFGLLLEQMPGFNPAVLRSAPEDPEKRLAWAEDQAAQILFNECLQRCSTTDKKAFITKFFGSPATVVDMKVKKVASGEGNTVITVSSGTRKAAQGSIDNYMLDKFLLKGLKDKEKKDAKAAAAKAAEEEEKGGGASPPSKRRRIAKDE